MVPHFTQVDIVYRQLFRSVLLGTTVWKHLTTVVSNLSYRGLVSVDTTFQELWGYQRDWVLHLYGSLSLGKRKKGIRTLTGLKFCKFCQTIPTSRTLYKIDLELCSGAVSLFKTSESDITTYPDIQYLPGGYKNLRLELEWNDWITDTFDWSWSVNTGLRKHATWAGVEILDYGNIRLDR